MHNNPAKVKSKLTEKIFLFALFSSLAFGKWGAWIGVPSKGIFLIDFLFFFTLFINFFKNGLDKKLMIFYTLPLGFYCILEMYYSDYGNFITKIRDLLPFLYLAFVPSLVNMINKIGYRRIILVFRQSTVVHLFWSTLVLFRVLEPLQVMPNVFGVPIFQNRWDLSGMVFGIGILSWSDFRKMGLLRNKVLIAFFAIIGVAQGSRAGALATLIALFVSLIYSDQARLMRSKIKAITFMSVITIILAILANITSSIFPDSFFSRIGFIGYDQGRQTSARNTAVARADAAILVLKWTKSSNKVLFGAGPGFEILQESGAIRYLSGNAEVRSPHNWFIGLFSRFGIIGTIFWLSLVAIPFVGSTKQRDMRMLAMGGFICILTTGSMGVIIESPFGSLPLTVFVGIQHTIRKLR